MNVGLLTSDLLMNSFKEKAGKPERTHRSGKARQCGKLLKCWGKIPRLKHYLGGVGGKKETQVGRGGGTKAARGRTLGNNSRERQKKNQNKNGGIEGSLKGRGKGKKRLAKILLLVGSS